MYTSRLDLAEDIRKESIAHLQARLSDALDLEAQMKQAHWNVKGREFFQLHRLFDSIHGEVEAYVEILAERITALGGVVDGRIATTATDTGLDPYPLQVRDGEAHLKAVARALSQFGASVRQDVDATETLGDADTADVLIQVSRGTDKQLWFVEAHLMAG
jgi:starvation-inducible DNA-binding protein